MKRLLIASVALALLGSSAALAQAPTSSPTNASGSVASPGGGIDTPTAPGANTSTDNSNMSGTPPMKSGNTMPMASGGSMPMATAGGTTMVGDQTASNPAPANYPRCTHKGQDRCMTTGRHGM